MPNLVNLIYASTATQPMSQDDLLEILRTSRVNNQKQNITGMLLYKNERFLQVLEGEEAHITTLYETITQDPRHNTIETISKRSIRERSFSQWQMGFNHLGLIKPAEMPGYSDFLNTPFDTAYFLQNPDLAFRFLYAFKARTHF